MSLEPGFFEGETEREPLEVRMQFRAPEVPQESPVSPAVEKSHRDPAPGGDPGTCVAESMQASSAVTAPSVSKMVHHNNVEITRQSFSEKKTQRLLYQFFADNAKHCANKFQYRQYPQ